MTRAQEPAELRPGLPPVELRRVWPRWIVTDKRDKQDALMEFKGSMYRFDWWSDDMPDRAIKSCNTWEYRFFRPRGASWSEVEALAAKEGAA